MWIKRRNPTGKCVSPQNEVGWNPASNSEGGEDFVVREVQGRRGPLNKNEGSFNAPNGLHVTACIGPERQDDRCLHADLPNAYISLYITPKYLFSSHCSSTDRTRFDLQLYRCYFVFSKNVWITAFPCLMFVGSVSTHFGSSRTGGDTQG